MNRAAQQGFTLLEMIVVLVIIGMLMGLVGPRLFNQADKAKAQTADTQVKMLRARCSPCAWTSAGCRPKKKAWRYSTRRLPMNVSGPSGTGPTSRAAYRWTPGTGLTCTATGRVPNNPFTLYSQGADGQPGGKGLDADVGYAPKR